MAKKHPEIKPDKKIPDGKLREADYQGRLAKANALDAIQAELERARADLERLERNTRNHQAAIDWAHKQHGGR